VLIGTGTSLKHQRPSTQRTRLHARADLQLRASLEQHRFTDLASTVSRAHDRRSAWCWSAGFRFLWPFSETLSCKSSPNRAVEHPANHHSLVTRDSANMIRTTMLFE
jgi:hypothetical protein